MMFGIRIAIYWAMLHWKYLFFGLMTTGLVFTIGCLVANHNPKLHTEPATWHVLNGKKAICGEVINAKVLEEGERGYLCLIRDKDQ